MRTSRRSSLRRLGAAAFAVVLGATAGCFYPIGYFVSNELSGGGSDGPPPPPTLDLAWSGVRSTLVGADGRTPSATNVRIDYRLTDPAQAPLSLEVLWRRSGEPESAFRRATEGPGSQGTTGLASASGQGAPHFFVWDAGRDLGNAGLVEEDVVVRLTARRADGALSAPRDQPSRVGNRAPVISVLPSSGPEARTVLTYFTAADSSGDATTLVLTAEGQSTAGVVIAVTVANVLAQGATRTPIQTPPNGSPGTVGWNSIHCSLEQRADDFGFRNLTVKLTLTATDLFGAAGVTTTTVSLVNNHPPAASILSAGAPGAPLRGRIPVTYTVTDPDALADPAGSGVVTLDVEVSTDRDSTFFPASGLPLGDGRFDLGLSRIGRKAGVFPDLDTGTAVFLWDACADVGATPDAGTSAILRFTPVSSTTGAAAVATIQVRNPVAFDPPVTLRTSPPGSSPVLLVAADLNGDGLLDIAVADARPGTSSGTITVLRARGDGSFGAIASAAVPGFPRAMVAADLTGDGILDLAVASAASGTITVLAGRGDGSFTVASITTAAADPRAIAVLDFDGDGVPDLAVLDGALGSRSVILLRGLAGGQLVPAGTIAALSDPRALLALDVTGDGLPDLVISDTGPPPMVRVVTGLRTGRFVTTSTALPDAHSITAVLPASFDGDGEPDLAALDPLDLDVDVIRGLRSGPISDLADSIDAADPVAIALADLTGDGGLDIVTANRASGTLTLLAGPRPGRLHPSRIAVLSVPGNPVDLVAADVTGDGNPDLVVATASGGVVLYRARGDLRVDVAASTGSFGGTTGAMVAGDLTGHGLLDVAVGLGDNILAFRSGQRDGSFFDVSQNAVSQVATPVAMIAADLDADSAPDLAAVDLLTGDLHVLLQGVTLGAAVGDGHFTLGQIVTGTGVPRDADGPHALAAADLDGDGSVDLAVVNQTNENVAVLLWDRQQRAFKPPTSALAGGPVYTAVIAVDLDGDGIPDLAAVSTPMQSVSVMHGMGDGTFLRPAHVLDVGGAPDAIVACDLTGDGIPDLAVTTVDGVQVLRGRGDLTFDLVATVTTSALAPFAPAPAVIVATDLDGDGVPDLAIGETGANLVSVLRVRPAEGFGAAARGERGGGPRLYPRTASPLFATMTPQYISVFDATRDGVPDLVVLDSQADVVRVLAVTHGRPSRPLYLGNPPAEVSADDLRVAYASPLDPALGEPGLVSTPTAGTRLRPASLASTVTPDTARFADDVELTLPLFSALTGHELEGSGGIIHVFRYERDAQGRRRLPYRPPLDGRIVEVASTAPDGVRPAFVAPATVSLTAGTIAFPVGRFGTFQSFIEVPTSTGATLLRETFDALPALDGALAPLPAGWVAGYSWQVGPPPVAGGPDAAASFPYVLGTNLRGAGCRPGADDGVTTTAIPIGSPDALNQDPQSPTRHVILSYREWARLGAGDRCQVEVIRSGVTTVVATRTTSTPGSSFADGSVDLTPYLAGGPSFRICFRLLSGNGGSRGWYLDDIDVAIVIDPR